MTLQRVPFPILTLFLFAGLLGKGDVCADDESSVRTPAEIRADVHGLHVEEVPWREVEWRTCLVQGLNESRRSNKPLVLWIFIDRPIDDERC